MKKYIKLLSITAAIAITFSSCEDADTRFDNDPTSGWIEFAQAETTVAVTSRTTDVIIPINFTAPINTSPVTVTYDIVNVSGNPLDVSTGLGSSLLIEGNTNTNSIVLSILPTAVQTLIDNGDVEFDIVLTSATRGIPVGIEGSVITHRVNLLCGGEPQSGTFVIDMHDSYGDGWQTDDASGGTGLMITLTDVSGTESIIEIGMCSPYPAAAGSFLGDGNCTGPASTSFFDATTTIDVSADTVGAIWTFPGDNWGEISFEIFNPDGTLLFAASANTDAGDLPVSYCQ